MKKIFSPNFFKFLLGFSIIILFAFLVLAVLQANGVGVDGTASLWYYLA